MTSVVLINPFQVPDDPEAQEKFVSGWQDAAAALRQQDGFISTTLHVSLDPSARFRFVNVAVWASAEHFRRAIEASEFQQFGSRIPYPNYPSLYRVVAN